MAFYELFVEFLRIRIDSFVYLRHHSDVNLIGEYAVKKKNLTVLKLFLSKSANLRCYESPIISVLEWKQFYTDSNSIPFLKSTRFWFEPVAITENVLESRNCMNSSNICIISRSHLSYWHLNII